MCRGVCNHDFPAKYVTKPCINLCYNANDSNMRNVWKILMFSFWVFIAVWAALTISYGRRDSVSLGLLVVYPRKRGRIDDDYLKRHLENKAILSVEDFKVAIIARNRGMIGVTFL